MQLVLSTPGAYLYRKEGLFRVRTEDKTFDISAQKVESILISTAATISTAAIKLAVEHNIDILFLDKYGNPYGRVWHAKPSSTTLIRRRQLEVAETEEGLQMALEWVGRKIENQVEFLLALRDKRTRKSAEITEAISHLRDGLEQLRSLTGLLGDRRQQVMGLEGSRGRIYFGILSALMPEGYVFSGRSRNPAKDEFNCLLNYAYGVLYGLVERACLVVGLDPFIGLLHTDNYAKKSLVFDLIENYRIWADEAVMSLFAGRKVGPDLFRRLENGFVLEKPGKVALLEALNQHLDTAVRYRGRNIKRRDVVQFDCHRLANRLIGKGEDRHEAE